LSTSGINGFGPLDESDATLGDKTSPRTTVFVGLNLTTGTPLLVTEK
jgi:hypothetical protein